MKFASIIAVLCATSMFAIVPAASAFAQDSPPAHRDYTARGGVTANAARDDANDADDAKDAQRRDASHGHDGRFLHGTRRHNPKC